MSTGLLLAKVQYEEAKRRYEMLCRKQSEWELGRISNGEYYKILVTRN
jgi:hypothetical protein